MAYKMNPGKCSTPKTGGGIPMNMMSPVTQREDSGLMMTSAQENNLPEEVVEAISIKEAKEDIE